MKIVAYYRVSSRKQGESKLGLEAQENAVSVYAAANGCEIVGAFTEVESAGKHNLDNRPALQAAINHARRAKALLVVAKLDRILRSTVVRTLLKTSGVTFIACDQPHASELTIDILAAVAEDEIRRIRSRTRDALAALKARGVLLGSHRPECKDNLSIEAATNGRRIGAARSHAKAIDEYRDLAPSVLGWHKEGRSLRAIASVLNTEGHVTRNGAAWSAMVVYRMIARAAVSA